MEITSELGIMNMEHYQFVKQKYFCRYINREGMA